MLGTTPLLGFLAVSVLVIITPGQDTALTIRNALRGGREAGVFTALGVVTGQLTWTLAASAGIATVLVASQPAFQLLKLAGALYLIYLGIQSLIAAVKPSHSTPVTPTAQFAQRRVKAQPYRQGLISNLGNAKMAVFFTSLLPQFVPLGGNAFWHLVPLGATFALMTLAWLSAYAIAVDRARGLIQRSPVRRALDAVTGLTLAAFGARLAVSAR